MEANEPAYILATSGTTARPKLAIHVHGGYPVHIHSMGRWCFELRIEDEEARRAWAAMREELSPQPPQR